MSDTTTYDEERNTYIERIFYIWRRPRACQLLWCLPEVGGLVERNRVLTCIVLLCERGLCGGRDLLQHKFVPPVVHAELDKRIPIMPAEEVIIHEVDHVIDDVLC